MSEPSSAPPVDLRLQHRNLLRSHAIDLLRMACARLDTASLAEAQEEDITGRIKEEIEHIIEVAPDAPPWVERYTVYDEEKPSGTAILGKKRPRIDITIKRSWKLREDHPRFRFEAKRLKADKRLSPYFGKEGIGCFLRGTYPLTHGEAAMLGYVQGGTLEDWQTRLGKYSNKNSRRLRMKAAAVWADFPCSLPHSSVTLHSSKAWRELMILHLLLDFSPKERC